MKKYNFIIVILVACSLFACKHEDEKTGGVWNSGALGEYKVEPINGGAIISYDIPRDPEILYIMAEYERNGKTFTEKSSIHKNSLTIEGFNTTEKVKATLYKVNKQEKRSDPLDIEFEPLESLVSIAKNSLEMAPGFAGVVASWDNPFMTEFGVRLMALNDENELETKEMYFSSTKDEKHSFRGFEPEETTFAIAFEDKWGNSSDTTLYTATPFFEMMVPKPYVDFRSSIPYDNVSNLSGRTTSTLWDNIVNTSQHGWLTQQGSSGLSITIDLGQVVKLSRIVIHGYHLNAPYTQVNIQQFEVWGTDKIDYDLLTNRPYWLDEFSVRNDAIHGVDNATVLPARTFKDDWQYLGHHAIIRYDQMVPVDNQAIADLAANGMEYEMPIDAPPVRYIRLFVREVANLMPPPSNNYFSMGEISFYGDNTVPQE